MMSNWEKDNKWAQLGDETYQSRLNKPPIQFPLHFESPIQDIYSNNSSSHVGDDYNNIEVGMDDFLRDNHTMKGMLLHPF